MLSTELSLGSPSDWLHEMRLARKTAKILSPHLPWMESLARLSSTHGRSQPDLRPRSRKMLIEPFLGVARRLASRVMMTATCLQNSAPPSPSTAEIATRKILSTTLGDLTSRPHGG